jgi:hypothetical protein
LRLVAQMPPGDRDRWIFWMRLHQVCERLASEEASAKGRQERQLLHEAPNVKRKRTLDSKWDGSRVDTRFLRSAPAVRPASSLSAGALRAARRPAPCPRACG